MRAQLPFNACDVNYLFNKRKKMLAGCTNITLINLQYSIHIKLETNFGYPSDHQFVTMLPAIEDRLTGKRLARAHAWWLGCGSTHAIHIGKMSSQVRGELSRCGSSVTYFDGLESFTRSDKLFSGLTKVLLMQTQNVLQELSTLA